VTHPGDDGGLGPLLDRDSFRPGDRPAPDRSCMIGDGPCQPSGEVGVAGMEGEEQHDRPLEVLDILGLQRLTTPGCGLLPLRVAFGGPLGLQFGSNPVEEDGRLLE
jgi:hypothetical protein